jgi:REP element-mobilizing transposase RayT
MQGELSFRTWGGRRAGAGRKPKGSRAGVPHRARPEHKAYYPVHATLRAERRLPSLRKQLLFLEVRRALAHASRASCRVVHFSVQSDHVHLLIEAHDKASLSRGMGGLAIRLARAVNRAVRRRGSVWADRYHARALRTPREVRHGLVYVIANWKKHLAGAKGMDPCSSAWWFDGWKVSRAPPEPPGWDPDEKVPVWAPRTWLASEGWRRHGLVGDAEQPRAPHCGAGGIGSGS